VSVETWQRASTLSNHSGSPLFYIALLRDNLTSVLVGLLTVLSFLVVWFIDLSTRLFSSWHGPSSEVNT